MLGLTILAGAFLRWYRLDFQSVWLDEAYSIRVALLSLPDATKAAQLDVHPPLSYILLHFWVGLFGTTEIAVRSLSVLMGLLTIPAIYALGRALYDSSEVGALASLLLAVSYFHIRYSQETRAYSLMVLLAILSMFWYLQLLAKGRAKYGFLYSVTTVLLTYTHYYGLFVPLVQNLVFALYWKRNKPRLKLWLATQLILGLVYLPWVTSTFQQTSLKHGISHYVPASFGTLVSLFTEFSNRRMSLLWGFGILVLIELFSITKTGGSFNWKEPLQSLETFSWRLSLSRLQPTILLGLWLVVPIVVSFALEGILPTFTYKNAIVSLPGFLILAARGLKNIDLPAIRWVVVIGLVVLALRSLGPYYRTVATEQWRDATMFVERNYKPGDLILFDVGYTR